MVLFLLTSVHAFISGIDPNSGITNINLPEAEIKRRMLQAARQRIIVADGSKFGCIERRYWPETALDGRQLEETRLLSIK